MTARTTRESGYVSREGQSRPWPQRLDRVIHDRTRLAIMAALAATETMSFTDLKATTGTTDGNLSVHARRLEEAGYISTTKDFEGRPPRTEYRLTRAGRHALERYLEQMETLIKDTRARSTSLSTVTTVSE